MLTLLQRLDSLVRVSSRHRAQAKPRDQFLSMFDKDGDGLFDSIEKALTIGDGVDPALGDNNKSIGQSNGSGS